MQHEYDVATPRAVPGLNRHPTHPLLGALAP